MSRALAVLLLVALALGAGCGGGHSAKGKGKPLSEPEREAKERADAARRIPAVDRIAYYQIAITSGLVRGNAAVTLARRGRAPTDAQLRDAGARLAELRPRDPNLARANRRLRVALRRLRAAPRSGPGKVRGARSALRATDAVNASLRAFVARTPAAAALTPD